MREHDRQEQSDLDAERIATNRRRSGRDITPRPSSQSAAEAYVAKKLHEAGINVVQDAATLRSALRRIERDLAIAGEENDWVRKWLIKKSGMIHGGRGDDA